MPEFNDCLNGQGMDHVLQEQNKTSKHLSQDVSIITAPIVSPLLELSVQLK
jgi:hypothetical protein